MPTPSPAARAAADLVLLVGGSLRLTRLVTTDTLPEWLVIWRVRRWAEQHEWRAESSVSPARKPVTWQAEAVKGLDCPFCVGFWLGAAHLAAYALTARSPRARAAWRGVSAVLALNYVVGHLSARLDA